VDYLPTERSIKFMSKMKWDELVPYMKKIYGEEYTKKFVKLLKEN
jgi:hypothetical protein